jgi:hypothetical protein
MQCGKSPLLRKNILPEAALSNVGGFVGISAAPPEEDMLAESAEPRTGPFPSPQTSVIPFDSRSGPFWNVSWCSILEQSTPRALGSRRRDHFMMVYIYQEKIAPPGPARTKPPDVLTLQQAIESLERENVWLKEQLARIVRDK